jgi:predicted nuclease with TOPRIM domain
MSTKKNSIKKQYEESKSENEESESENEELESENEESDCTCNDLESHDYLLRYGRDFGDHGIHYGMCIYCLMEDKIEWMEEWDSWAEVAGRVAKLVKYGFQDEIDNIQYNTNGLQPSDSWVKELISIYNLGRTLAKSKSKKK